MIGAGALGCEYTKAFALMGLGCSEYGRLFIADHDTIKYSNLTSQFLYDKSTIGQNKARVISDKALTINPKMFI